jgi:hypothetical protein
MLQATSNQAISNQAYKHMLQANKHASNKHGCKGIEGYAVIDKVNDVAVCSAEAQGLHLGIVKEACQVWEGC